MLNINIIILSEAPSPCACSSEVGIAVGALLLVEGIIAVVTAIIVVYCCLVIRYSIAKVHDPPLCNSVPTPMV